MLELALAVVAVLLLCTVWLALSCIRSVLRWVLRQIPDQRQLPFDPPAKRFYIVRGGKR